MRQTRQRDAIKDAIRDAGAPVGPREILDAARAKVSHLGMATVYRAIGGLLDAGAIVQVDVPGQAPRYELAGKHHHHHFHCRRCHKMYEIDGCPGDLARFLPKGFTLENHELTLTGLCSHCSRN